MTPSGAYSTGSPSFDLVPGWNQQHTLFTNVFVVGAPAFAKPWLTVIYQLTALSFAVSGLSFAPVGPVLVNYIFHAVAYSTGSPTFGFPRLSQTLRAPGLPPSYYTQAQDAAAMLTTYLNTLLAAIPPGTAPEINKVRGLIATLRANADEAVRGTTLGTDLSAINVAAFNANASYAGIEAVRVYLMTQVASRSLLTQMIFRSALTMTLALQSKIVVRMTFKTKEQVRNMILHRRDAFDAAKAVGIDEVDVLVYQAINAMGGALMNHLATVELELPRFVTYTTQTPMPSLYLANRIYQDPSRYEEIEDENDVIHPAFCPITLRVLSNVGRPNRL
jgi:hypothetical protein